MNLGLVAGEISGDILGAGLLSTLKTQISDVNAIGIGGPRMMATGMQSLYDMDRLSVIGLVEPLFRIPELLRIRHNLYKYFIQHKPDVFIGIDAPDFNLGLELKLRKAGIPVIHYVSPSVWAWRQKRVYKIAKATDLVLTLFPFEVEFYKKFNVPAYCVGHPLADQIPLHVDKNIARHKLGLDVDGTYIAILPGSRKGELKYLADVFIQAAELCKQERADLKFITSAVNAERDAEFKSAWKKIAPSLPLTFFQGQSHDVMAAADVILIASGTATLEAMLYKKPMVIAYRMAPLSYHIIKHLVSIKFVGLPNLLANESLVPELIQNDATPAKMFLEIMNFLNHPGRVATLEQRFLKMHQQLRLDANQQAAQAVIDLVKMHKK